jgi:serine phosphatase RsbU (regulator of sigma subunit)
MKALRVLSRFSGRIGGGIRSIRVVGPRAQAVPPVLLIAAIVLGSWFAPLAVHLSPLLVAAPVYMAAYMRIRSTVAVALAAGAAVVAVDWRDGLLHSPLLPIHVGAVLAVSAFALAAQARRSRDLSELIEVRAVSEATQRVLLRPIPGRLGLLRVASVYRAAAAHAVMGGDLYAASRSGRTTRILIGDVRGKGLPAIEDASAVLGAFREAAPQHSTLPELAASLECSFRRHLTDLTDSDPEHTERFVTALLIELPDEGEVVRIVACGHPPPLLWQRGQVSVFHVNRPAPPLGLAGDTPHAFQQGTATFGPGDTLLLFTDGLTEARNARHGFYPLLDRAARWNWEHPYRLLQQITQDVDSYTGGRLDDDLAMVAVQQTAGDQSAEV